MTHRAQGTAVVAVRLRTLAWRSRCAFHGIAARQRLKAGGLRRFAIESV